MNLGLVGGVQVGRGGAGGHTAGSQVEWFIWLLVLHLRSYQDGYQLLTVHTHDDLIVLSHWETRQPRADTMTLHYLDTEPTSHCSILLMPSARL